MPEALFGHPVIILHEIRTAFYPLLSILHRICTAFYPSQ